MQTLPMRMNVETEMYRKMMDQLSTNIRVSCPGIIQSFDSDKQTATVQLAINERINLNGDLSWEQIPVLLDVPVLFPRSGGYSITFPVRSGNECLVVFSDMCIDSHYQSGGINNIQPDKRRHDLSDGMCFITGTSQPNSLSSVSTNSLQIRSDDGSTIIDVTNGTITLTATNVNINATTLDINVTNYSMNATNSTSSASGHSSIDGKVFLDHEHSDPQGGHTGGVL